MLVKLSTIQAGLWAAYETSKKQANKKKNEEKSAQTTWLHEPSGNNEMKKIKNELQFNKRKKKYC